MPEKSIVAVMLNGGRVTREFRDALFSSAARSGISVNEFVLQAAAEKIRRLGQPIESVFEPGDLNNHNDNADIGLSMVV